MHIGVKATGGLYGRASQQLLSNNIEAYEDTIPSMLSDRLRNPKFGGPENLQTGMAAEWEPVGNTMTGMACRLIPGMYMSGREAQLVHNYTQHNRCGILQAGVQVRAGEEFEVEMWARVQHHPVVLSVELRLPGQTTLDTAKAEMTFNLAHWHRRTCRITAPGTGTVSFQINVPGDSRVIIDQVHLRPVGQTHVCQEMIDAFDQLPCPVLRFPGGCVTCTYHWEHGIGPVHLRPVCDDPVFRYKAYYDFGTDEYLALCAAKGIRPFITLNTTTATPEDAAAWASYVRNWHVTRNLAIPATYFMFGNENYGIHEIGHMTGEMYAAQLREFVPPLRAAYPEARILAIGEFESAGLREEDTTSWRSVIIEKAADLFDTLVVTRYSHGPDNLPLAKSMECVADNVADKEADLRRQAQSIRDAKLKCTMGIVEWNYWTRASHNDHAGFYEPNDIRHCLYAAGYLNAFCRTGDILEVTNYYSLVNTMGMIHVHDGRVQFSDMAKVFSLYAPALPGDVLELGIDSPALTGKSKTVDANFIRTDEATYGFLINYSATETAEVLIEGFGAIAEATGLKATAILTPVEVFQPVFDGQVVTLPAMSLVRICCSF